MRFRALPILAMSLAGCTGGPSPAPTQPSAGARNVVLITIDTLRADHVGSYGAATARTPALDGLARDGVRFDRAYATAPITLVSHASLLTGRYPPGHGARHNGLLVDRAAPTLAEAFSRGGLATGAFVAAFPLDRRFGLNRGFDAYGDTMPRDATGRLLNERPGRIVVDEALAWLGAHRNGRFFLWVHLFEPHAPYGNPSDPAQAARPAIERYDAEITEADAQAGRLIAALGDLRRDTLVVAAADHGEAFGEHGEITHSVFVYDVTLRVPLILSGPGIVVGRVIAEPVSLIDVAPTIASLAGLGPFDGDGIDLSGFLRTSDVGHRKSDRALYAESFAPMFDFGWSKLRTLRKGDWKYIAAPKPELYDVQADPGETHNLVDAEPSRAADLRQRIDAISGSAIDRSHAPDADTRARLSALGYISGTNDTNGGARPDPKDRRELAARLAEVLSGELRGADLERVLRAILRDDPANPQANLRLGYALLETSRCREARARFDAAIAGHLPGADAYLGRAHCELAARDARAARRSLDSALVAEPGNPVASANLGMLLSDTGEPSAGIPHLQRALAVDPDLDQARFALALAFARANRRADAAREASDLLRRLPPDAPQRSEVERLLRAVR